MPVSSEYEIKVPREVIWNPCDDEDYGYAEKAILTILKEEKVSLSKTRYLFNNILRKIEDENPISL